MLAPERGEDVFLEAARQLGVEPTKCHVFETAAEAG
jgi:beta-phosphoglucomutase-like phosphatase (HAD superfamily)